MRGFCWSNIAAGMNPRLQTFALLIGWLFCASWVEAQVAVGDVRSLPADQAGPATSFLPSASIPEKPEAPNVKPAASGEAPRERYALKTDDTIVAGFIEDAGETFSVRRAGSRMYIPKHQVQYIGDSLPDLYRYRAHRIPIKDLALRAELGQWCFDRGLVDFAYAEASLVLSQDPTNAAALRLRKLCMPKVDPAGPEGESPYKAVGQRKAVRPEPRQVVNQFKRAYGEDLFKNYIEMQNLLIVSCGKGSCHGPRHEGPFKFYRRLDGSPGDIKLTARNMMSMLNAIDYREPLKSPVLYKALQRHGATTLPPLGGVQDPTYVKLQEWVLGVARRWAGNEIELDPRRVPLDGGDDPKEDFAGGRPENQPQEIIVRRTGRPEVPVLQPGNDIAKIRSGPPLADDAPPPKSARKEPSGEKSESPPSSADPYSPDGFNRGQTGAGTNRRSANSSSIVEMKDGKPVVKRTVSLPGAKDGTTFEAATPPISLQPKSPAK